MDFRGLVVLCLVLTACGEQRTATSVLEKTSEECSSDVLPNQFAVKYFDGRLEKVSADSEQKFIDGFLTENLDQIQYAERDYRVSVKDVIARPLEAVTYADNWGVSRVNAQAVWQQNVRGAGVIVAVIDTGMDINHPQLKKQLATNAGEMGFDNQGRDKSSNGVDDDGNGFVDDAGGYDFVLGRSLTGDYTGHGTHVAGVIAAAHTDTVSGGATYVQGMAPAAKILPLAFLDSKGSGSMLNGVLAIRYAVKRGAKVINASWGGPGCSRTLKDSLAELEGQGVIFVSAAGNDSQNVDRYPSYPASFAAAAQIVVGAIDPADLTAEYSNYGVSHVHIYAPGTDIISTFPNGKMAMLSGTSMATPFVAGAIALMLSAEPSAKVAKIRQALYASSDRRTSYLNASQGRMNLATALTELRR